VTYAFPWLSTPIVVALNAGSGNQAAKTKWRWATPFYTMIIVTILVAGLGVIGRSQGSAHA